MEQMDSHAAEAVQTLERVKIDHNHLSPDAHTTNSTTNYMEQMVSHEAAAQTLKEDKN